MHIQRTFLLSALIAICLPCSAAHADVQLRFGIYTSDKASAMVLQFRPLLNAIESGMREQLQQPVQISIQVARSYEQGIADLVNGRVDFSRFGPASYVLATEQNSGIRLLAMENNKGSKRFKGMIIVRTDSGISTIEDLRGTRFAFGNARSTIGRYLSQKYLLDHQVTAEDLADYSYLGRHDAVAAAVAAGDFDAGAVKSRTVKNAKKKGMPVRILAEFENVTKPWIARSGLDPELFTALRDALLTLTDEKALASLGKQGFLAGEDAEYDFVRDAMRVTRGFRD